MLCLPNAYRTLMNLHLPEPLTRPYRRWKALRHLRSPEAAQNAVGEVTDLWRKRINDVLAAPDNAYIEHVPEAGTLDGAFITMHNGVRVCANGYFGSGTLNMLLENRGVHEPQEERAFEEIIRLLPEDCTMVELGAYWGFYSLSLLKQRPKAHCLLVEPELENLWSGKLNFKVNRQRGTFIRAIVGNTPSKHPPTVSVDDLVNRYALDRIHLLHSDIQGYELEMLHGAKILFDQRNIDYVFISTHSNRLHEDCIAFLKKQDFRILCEANLDQSYSRDGLIVARRAEAPGPDVLEIHSAASESVTTQ